MKAPVAPPPAALAILSDNRPQRAEFNGFCGIGWYQEDPLTPLCSFAFEDTPKRVPFCDKVDESRASTIRGSPWVFACDDFPLMLRSASTNVVFDRELKKKA
jgi:hypothetical protein